MSIESPNINREKIVLSRYRFEWFEAYQAAKSGLFSTLSNESQQMHIEHIGSTAIEGLIAKPVVDIMIGVVEPVSAHAFDSKLATLGFYYTPDVTDGQSPSRLYIRRDDNAVRTHHIHLVPYNSTFWYTRIVFRDYLREQASIRQLYATLKTIAAQKFPRNRLAYNDYKSPFISACIQSAISTHKTDA